MRRRRAGALAVLAAACLGAAITPSAAAEDPPRASSHLDHAPKGPTPVNRLLRLVDLPPGYEVTSDYWLGGDGSCDEGPAPTGHHRVACEISFGDNWRPAGISRPREIESVAHRFDDVASATAAFEARADIAFELFEDLGDPATAQVPGVPIGDDARIWSWEDFSWSGAIVAWRWRHVIAMVHVTGGSMEVSERAALRLAALQQTRVSKLTPVLPADNDDSEVALDSPRLQVPILWLDRHFEPGGGLPALDLVESSWAYAGGEGPGWSADVTYVGRRAAVRVALFRPRAWKRYKRGAIGKRIFDFSCTKPKRIRIPGGWAALRSTKDRGGARCQRSGNHFFSIAHLPHVVAAVNVPHCVLCVGGRTWGVSNRPAVMRAVVRGLRPRL